MLQWGHRLSAMEGGESSDFCPQWCVGFNGAIAFQRWKGCISPPSAPSISASMGPSPFSDGRVVGHLNDVVESGELQWGHRLSAMEGRLNDGVVSGLFWVLQWGHRLSAMEGAAAPVFVKTCPQWLQWGHRLSAMEGLDCWRWSTGSGSLQWGHRLSAMEGRNLSGTLQGPSLASMGPSPFSDGRSASLGAHSWSISTGFNGAIAFQRWKVATRRRP